ncbi:TPA: RES family NAD+ phosphorylase [Escherichia coli]|nr:RES family NAD+ phosphorylase [Escherichia coli]
MCSKNPAETWICAECITEPFLSAEIEKEGTRNACDYCGAMQNCFDLEAISDLTEQAIAEHYVRTPTDMSDYESAMSRHSEGDYFWEREGDDIVCVIENLLEVRPEVALDIHHILKERHYDFEAAKMGEESEFASGSCYEERGKVNTEYFDNMWERFVTSLKTESRYVNQAVSETLGGIFSNIETLESVGGRPVILEAGPEAKLSILYRARWSRDHDDLERMLITPDRELGPPPYRFSGANRMSARGISVFYGASSVETAISEIRPPVGCNVVTAKFNLIRPLRLLNLPALKSVLERGSKFDPEFIRKREQAAFLRTLTRRIVDPVLPGEEDFSYIPTQVIAEYLADPSLCNLDGILYPSVQLSGTGQLLLAAPEECFNVVLFHKASRVRWQTLPAQEDCMIRYGHLLSEDEWEPDICVTEIIKDIHGVSLLKTVDASRSHDFREPALEIDLTSVSVHEIRAARFEYSTDTVRRERYSYSPKAPAPREGSELPPWEATTGQSDTPF